MKTIQLTDAQILHLRHAIETYRCNQDDLLERHKETLAFNKKHYPDGVNEHGYKTNNTELKQWIKELVGCERCLGNIYDKITYE